jgi:hypothetical protein
MYLTVHLARNERLAERDHFRNEPLFRDGTASDTRNKVLNRRAVLSYCRLYLCESLLERHLAKLRFAARWDDRSHAAGLSALSDGDA